MRPNLDGPTLVLRTVTAKMPIPVPPVRKDYTLIGARHPARRRGADRLERMLPSWQLPMSVPRRKPVLEGTRAARVGETVGGDAGLNCVRYRYWLWAYISEIPLTFCRFGFSASLMRP